MDFGLWRLTRNRHGRRVYEALGRLGVTATRMYEYVADLDGAAGGRNGPVSPGTERRPPDADRRPGGADGGHDHYADLCDDEHVVAARVDGREIGHLFLSVDASRRVAPLETDLAFDGAYLRRIWVNPDHRRQGIASAMLATALDEARTLGAACATALVALDNRPSRRLFERRGFRRERVHTYARVGPLSWRRVSNVTAPS